MSQSCITSTVNLPFRYAVGKTASRFLQELRDQRKIWGTECPICKKVWVPARSFCGECRQSTERWIELSSHGRLVGWTGREEEGGRLTALIRLDGADSLLLHRLEDYAGTPLREDLPVEAVWNPQRKGTILDIAYFRPERES